ncbi:response regulator [Chitinophaga lutea]
MKGGYHFLLADDHSIIRLGVKALIRENFPTGYIHEAENGQEVSDYIKKYEYDLIMLDINMPDTDFLSLMAWLRATRPDTQVLVFSMHPENIYGVRSIQLGAGGYLRKTAPDQEIVTAIQRLLDNRKYISAELAELLSDKRNAEQKSANPFDELSTREMEIAILLDKGISLPEICRQLNIQYSTANTYKRRIFEKLNVFNLVTLTRLMRSHGFMT